VALFDIERLTEVIATARDIGETVGIPQYPTVNEYIAASIEQHFVKERLNAARTELVELLDHWPVCAPHQLADEIIHHLARSNDGD